MSKKSKKNIGFIDTIIYFMEQAEGVQNFRSSQKEEYVINKLKQILTPEDYKKYRDIFPFIIHLICEMTKGALAINVNDLQKKM